MFSENKVNPNNSIDTNTEIKLKTIGKPIERNGMIIGVICPGVVPIKWMMHMMNMGNSLPGGLYWSYVYACGDFKKDSSKNYASLRTEVVEKALDMGVKYILFIDSDVFIPRDAVNRLMAHDKDIVTGVYWMKTMPPQPVVYKNIGDGPIWKIKIKDELEEIGGAGLGCCLIKTEVFRKFKEAGIKLFDQDWIHEASNGRRIQVSIGEDHYFYEKARQLGFKAYMDSNVLCDHYDVNTDTFYPGEKVTRDITREKLKEEGKTKIIEHQLLVRNVEKDKPTVIFYNANNVKFNGDSIKNKPISGSETALIQMANEMKSLGWNVHVFCNCDVEGYYNNIGYYNYDKINDGMSKIRDELGHDIDIFISSRDIRPFLGGRPPVKKTILWMHDMPNSGTGNIENAMPFIDKVFFVSDYQKEQYTKKYIINKEKIFVTRNGIDESRFNNPKGIQKRRGMCIYTTTPFRGLDVLAGNWNKIKERAPHAELYVYSDMSIYGQKNVEDIERIFSLLKGMKDKGVFLFKPITQDRLAEVMLEADIMTYPNHFPETSCITAMESIKAKTPVISTNLGALSKTINSDEGVLIEGDAHTDEYGEKFVEQVVKMLNDDNYRNTFCKKDRNMSWKKVAKEWNKVFLEDPIIVKIKKTKEGKIDVNTKDFWNKKYTNIIETERAGSKYIGQKERFDIISKILPKDGSIAEVGCGQGNLLKYLYDNHIGKILTGFDISDVAIDEAKKRVPLASFYQVSEKSCNLPVNNVDVIVSLHTIEHLQKPEKYIKKWAKSLNKGGEIILIVPLEDEYLEHINIYNLGICEEFAKKVALDYEIKSRSMGGAYTSGPKKGQIGKEAIIRLFF